MAPMQGILWFALPIFEYHYWHRHEGRFLDGRTIQHARLQSVLTEMIGDAVKRPIYDARVGLPADLVARYVASTFVLVLDWWLASSHPIPPKAIESAFLSFVSPGVACSASVPYLAISAGNRPKPIVTASVRATASGEARARRSCSCAGAAPA